MDISQAVEPTAVDARLSDTHTDAHSKTFVPNGRLIGYSMLILIPPADGAADREVKRVTLELLGDEYMIGRTGAEEGTVFLEGGMIFIQEPYVSREHCVLRLADDCVQITHIGNNNPTLVDGNKVPKSSTSDVPMNTDVCVGRGVTFKLTSFRRTA